MKSYCEHCGKVHDLDAPHLGMKTKSDLPKIPIPPEVLDSVFSDYEKQCAKAGGQLDLAATIIEMGDAPEEVAALLREMGETQKKWSAQWRKLCIQHEARKLASP